ncbi:class I SAM-dependent DNA methyltransferase [Alteribacillus sp. HJP-4]|uniref:class I SAM-dependent DNA methyltransferase n=1 Tax=Alteribacillus sp. HJP-4 TaxID=2775394 RepID=UPI0035CCF762
MESYKGFAEVYDVLMENAPYLDWADFIEGILTQQEMRPCNILDLGCGTGTLINYLSKRGYKIDGVDLSEDMLAVAQQKNFHYKPVLIKQDMRKLHLPHKYDVILSMCDAVNYLRDKKSVLHTFQAVSEHLNDGGLFIFDAHSCHYLDTVLSDFSYADNAEDISYIWNCSAGSSRGEVEHELTLFLKQKGNEYIRYDEVHIQKTFTEKTYIKLLEEAGLHRINTFADFSFDKPAPDSDRLFFIAKKIYKKQ